MAKISGLDVRLFVEGTDLSGDVSSITGIGSEQNLLDVTTLDKSATARLAGLKSGTLSLSTFFDNSAGHSVWSATTIPTGNQNVLITLGGATSGTLAIGDGALQVVAKQGTYYTTRNTGGPITCSVDYESADGLSPDFSELLTAGVASANTTTSYTAIDNSASSSAGARGMVQVTGMTSGTANLLIEDSPDNLTYSTLISFDPTSAVGSESKAVTGTVERYIRFTIQDAVGFSGCQFIAGVVRL